MKWFFYFLSVLIFFSCTQNNTNTKNEEGRLEYKAKDADSETIETEVLHQISALELFLIEQGLVNVQELDSSILVDIKYSTTDNFMKEDMYGDFDKAYLQKDVAEKLIKAQAFLKETHPNLSLLIYDAVRPRHIQQKMWDALQMPIHEKVKFVSNPKYGSLHNFGAAVDVTLADKNGKALDMGTPFDYIGKLAYPTLEKQNLEAGLLVQKQIENRKLLRKVMYKAGFFNIQTEWWHFNSCYRAEAKQKYKIVE